MSLFIVLAFIGGAVGFGLLLLPCLTSQGEMGWGDIKMAGVIGLATGFPKIFIALL